MEFARRYDAARRAGRPVRRRGVRTRDRRHDPRRLASTRALLYSGAGRLSAKAARAAGAHGFITKERDATELADAIRRVGRGLTVFDDAAPSGGWSLTDRERQVLERVAGGMTNAEIATELHLSPNTVKQHASMFRKIGARNRTEAVRAQRLGVLELNLHQGLGKARVRCWTVHVMRLAHRPAAFSTVLLTAGALGAGVALAATGEMPPTRPSTPAPR